jgi:hypothetical protein
MYQNDRSRCLFYCSTTGLKIVNKASIALNLSEI